MTGTGDLIESLAARARPVRRLAPPLLRAGLWLAAFGLALGLVTIVTGAWPAMLARLHDARFAVEMTATFLTGLCAVIAAFYLSLPDRSRAWIFLPLPPLLLWLTSSGYECYRNWLVDGADGWRLGRSSDCFIFIVALSIPLAAALYFVLRRALPLDPLRVMAAGGLGVAALAAATLQFYHPFDVTFVDLAVHAAAVLIVVVAMTLGGRFNLAVPRA